MAKRGPTLPRTIEEIDDAIKLLRKQRAAKIKALRDEEDRKDTLRRTLLGGALIERARGGDVPAKTLLNELQAQMTGRDATPFQGWSHDQTG